MCRDPTRSRRAPSRSTTLHGVCHLLFNNAGVGGGGVAKPWNWTPNDWTWCFGVNVFGVGHCVASFVPRMIEGGEEGWVVNTSSGDGGFQPLAGSRRVRVVEGGSVHVHGEPRQLVHQRGHQAPRGGVLSGRQRLARDAPLEQQPQPTRRARAGASRTSTSSGTTRNTRSRWRSRACKVADLVELGHSVLRGPPRGQVHHPAQHRVERRLMMQRAEKIGRGELPTIKRGGAFE